MSSMLSNKNIICPENLLKIAKDKGPIKAVIVNAVKKVAIESAKQAVEANLIIPLFVGDKSIIEKISKEINWDISKYEIVHEPDENSTAPIAAKLASEGKVKIIVKGNIPQTLKLTQNSSDCVRQIISFSNARPKKK